MFWYSRTHRLAGLTFVMCMVAVACGGRSPSHTQESLANLNAALAVIDPLMDDLPIEIERSVTQREVEERFFRNAQIVENARVTRAGRINVPPETAAQLVSAAAQSNDLTLAENSCAFVTVDATSQGVRWISENGHVVMTSVAPHIEAEDEATSFFLWVSVPAVGEELITEDWLRLGNIREDQCWFE